MEAGAAGPAGRVADGRERVGWAGAVSGVHEISALSVERSARVACVWADALPLQFSRSCTHPPDSVGDGAATVHAFVPRGGAPRLQAPESDAMCACRLAIFRSTILSACGCAVAACPQPAGSQKMFSISLFLFWSSLQAFHTLRWL